MPGSEQIAEGVPSGGVSSGNTKVLLVLASWGGCNRPQQSALNSSGGRRTEFQALVWPACRLMAVGVQALCPLSPGTMYLLISLF